MKIRKGQNLLVDTKNQKFNRHKSLNAILSIVFILSMCLSVWGIVIYRRTIIEPKYLFGVVSSGTILAAIILFFVTKEFLNAFWTLLLAFAIGGGITYFVTLYLNKELGEKEIYSEIFSIQRTGNLAKGRKSVCRSPFAIINFYGLEKQLVFYCEYEQSIHNYKKVKVEYFEGLFGFPYIQNQTLVP